jgi:hypothetical protein
MNDFSEREQGQILIDKDGQWRYEGAPIVRQDIVALLSEHLVQGEDGSYWILWRGQECKVEVEDTPFVVWSVSPVQEKGETVAIVLHLNDGSMELFDPATLTIGSENVPYCRVKKGRFRARFSRKAYYQLARMIEEEEGGFFLKLGQRKYPVQHEPI